MKKTIFNPELPYIKSPAIALVLLFSIFGFFALTLPFITSFLTGIIKKPQAAMQIAMLFQDIFLFIFPAIITALLATRLPARLLAINPIRSWSVLLLAIATLLCAIPAMNAIVEWNQNLHFPTELSALETAIRNLEDSANAAIETLMTGANIATLILSVLIIGVMAGFSEEIFFRGAMQRLLTAQMQKPAISIWLTAIIFSVLHFQFFGFVPRMLLGAFFGYMLYWSGSIWIPIALHVLNNSIVVISSWWGANHPNASATFEEIGTTASGASQWISVTASALLTIILLYCTFRVCMHERGRHN